jgi:predicted nucleotidyltransferase
MLALIENNRNSIHRLCHRYDVLKLDLFGSATGKAFNDAHSDLDFAVLFAPCSPQEHYENYFGLMEGLEELLEHPVDLVEYPALRNPYFIQSLEASRKAVYAA